MCCHGFVQLSEKTTITNFPSPICIQFNQTTTTTKPTEEVIVRKKKDKKETRVILSLKRNVKLNKRILRQYY